ncbi:class I SAM-dependent methyltransferase [Erythrobacter alti]|uniref:class I SAM-dependent methyltransferase n=1 Tax=Erythrobacter alti TaxID=1896145 RepID=UPI0030F43BE2
MIESSEWQGKTGDSWAQEWRRTDRSFGQLTEELLARTRGFSFSRVLDVGCGAGELSLAIARGRHDATVTGIDISPRLIEVAKERGSRLPNAIFKLADASKWHCDPATAPDFIVSRHGVMFFDDPVAAFGHLSSQSAKGAGMLFSCFRELQQNPVFTEILRLLPELPENGDPHAPGPFAFADIVRVEQLLLDGGWEQFTAAPFDFPMIVGSGEDAIEDTVSYFSRIGPAARIAAELDLDARERFFDRVRTLAERHMHGNIVAFPAATWIVTARKA